MRLETTIELTCADRELVRLQAIELFEDGSGGRGLLTINSGHFSCTSSPFYFDKFEEFCEGIARLYRDLKGELRFGHTYEHDFIHFQMDKLGHVTVHGEVAESCADSQKLAFRFTTDQSCLLSLIATTECALKEMETTNSALRRVWSELSRLFTGER